MGFNSTGTLDINLDVNDEVRISNLTDINLGVFTGVDAVGSSAACVYRNGTGNYQLTASGDGVAGAFTLTDGVSTVAYAVTYDDGGGALAASTGIADHAAGGSREYAVAPAEIFGRHQRSVFERRASRGHTASKIAATGRFAIVASIGAHLTLLATTGWLFTFSAKMLPRETSLVVTMLEREPQTKALAIEMARSQDQPRSPPEPASSYPRRADSQRLSLSAETSPPGSARFSSTLRTPAKASAGCC